MKKGKNEKGERRGRGGGEGRGGEGGERTLRARIRGGKLFQHLNYEGRV